MTHCNDTRLTDCTQVPLTNSSPSGTVTGQDTFQMGSGTKPFTATAVMQLVEAGKVKLDDPVHIHVDKPMTDMWNTTFVRCCTCVYSFCLLF